MRKVIEYEVTPADGKIETGTALAKEAYKSILKEKDFRVDEMRIKVCDVYSSINLQQNLNGNNINNTVINFGQNLGQRQVS